ncbi:MAG: hypothetical protein AAF581_06820 [Planctomycetota bacterium]
MTHNHDESAENAEVERCSTEFAFILVLIVPHVLFLLAIFAHLAMVA